ncbi:MAG: hypothetical protein C0465_25915 [Ralstonia sp.]|uniref:hypothetical protein n=1 Tax=Ralstonia sp. TaxID=54061 RepID=UPI002579DF11|nr:hypothetical protein [Ralstonia sp.]MBA4234013.1 hypothetical protein [Ralstonia sp.]
MNTNMSSANQSNNGGNIVINNAALQLLIASKNEAQVAEFEAETGWTWQAACETSIETATANLLASKSAAEIADFEAATGWKWSDAVDESILAGIEANLRELSQSAENESPNDKFERETGWTYGDAVDMAAELRREDSIFGTRH